MIISVIVPVYNVENYLEQCLNSIIHQSYRNLEIILVDDGSVDQSARICNEFSRKDSRIKVIHQVNSGVSVARNTGIEAATGDYITFVDSDDWLETDMYKAMCDIAKSTQNVELVMCDFVNVKSNTNVNISSDIRGGYYTKKEIISEIYPTLLVTEYFGRIPIVSVCNCLFKKELLMQNKVSFEVDLRYSEDYLFMAQVMLHTDTFYYLKGYNYYNYRQYEQSRSKKFQFEWWSNLLFLNNKMKNLLSDTKEYDFSRQIKLQLIHSALFLSSSISSNKNIHYGQKLILLKELFNDSDLKAAFSNLVFQNQPIMLKVVLNLVKYRMARGYLIYRKIISKIKS